IRYVFFKAGLPEVIAERLDVEALELEIFEGKSGSKQLGTYARDRFFDAVIVAANSRGKIFGDDSITPHTDGPLKDPKPLLFLKILPNVTFRFSMELEGSHIEPAITAGMKRNVFERILKTMGIGAKTNVGYGQLIAP
ncbi:MAG: type III-B CRISPR module RAMP protein Cmr6, partial [Bacteroidetes bacterium]|nr:type III-B CRISPR module RAMP protein Cmr6 [Bacteroidota bacterium]